MPAELADVPVAQAAVFTFPGISLDVDSPSLPAMPADALRGWLRQVAKERNLSPGRRRKVEILFEQGNIVKEASAASLLEDPAVRAAYLGV